MPATMDLPAQLSTDAEQRQRARFHARATTFRQLILQEATGKPLSESQRERLADAIESLDVNPQQLEFHTANAKAKLAADAAVAAGDPVALGAAHERAIVERNKARLALVEAEKTLLAAEHAATHFANVAREAAGCAAKDSLVFGGADEIDSLFDRTQKRSFVQPTARLVPSLRF